MKRDQGKLVVKMDRLLALICLQAGHEWAPPIRRKFYESESTKLNARKALFVPIKEDRPKQLEMEEILTTFTRIFSQSLRDSWKSFWRGARPDLLLSKLVF